MAIKTVDRFFYRVLGNAIKEKRLEKKLSVAELATKLGISRQQMNNYEDGTRKIKDAIYDDLCDVLGIYNKIDIKVTLGL